MTAILLVDDHPVVRDGYRRLLEREAGWRVVAEADSAAAAYIAYRRTTPDIVLMDLSMPGPGGIEAVRHIRQWDKAARILVLTMHGNAAFALKAFEAGATGYATKSGDAAELVDLVRRVLRGERALSAEMARTLAAERIGRGSAGLDDLGPRETEILRLVASGLTAKEIAGALNLSQKTVQNYHYAIKAKVGARTDARAYPTAPRSSVPLTLPPQIGGGCTTRERESFGSKPSRRYAAFSTTTMMSASVARVWIRDSGSS